MNQRRHQLGQASRCQPGLIFELPGEGVVPRDKIIWKKPFWAVPAGGMTGSCCATGSRFQLMGEQAAKLADLRLRSALIPGEIASVV